MTPVRICSFGGLKTKSLHTEGTKRVKLFVAMLLQCR